jgi:hypothetical protein
MSGVDCVAYGQAAIEAGTPDYGQNGHGLGGLRTDAVDTIANVLHLLAFNLDDDPQSVLASALRHHLAERAEIEARG